MDDLKLARQDMIAGIKAATQLSDMAENRMKISPRQSLVAFGISFVTMSRGLGIDDEDAAQLLELFYDLYDQYEADTEGTEH